MTGLADLAHFGVYDPAEFGWGARDPFDNARLLVPFSHSGVRFGSMHRDVVPLFTALLDELVPLIEGGLVAGQCGCYNPDSVTQGGSRSFHTYAIAIDVNWGANPMGRATRPTGPHTIPAAAAAIAKRYGMEWGGTWSSPKDWMHFEVHLSPADARSAVTEGFTMDAEAKAAFAALNRKIDAKATAIAEHVTATAGAKATALAHHTSRLAALIMDGDDAHPASLARIDEALTRLEAEAAADKPPADGS